MNELEIIKTFFVIGKKFNKNGKIREFFNE